MRSRSGKFFTLLLGILCLSLVARCYPATKISCPFSRVPEQASPDTSNIPKGYIQVPDSLKGADAVIVYKNIDYKYRINSLTSTGFNLFETVTAHKMIRIQTKKGLDDYSRMSLGVNRYSNLEKIEFHIITPDGTSRKVEPVTHRTQDAEDDIGSHEEHLRYSIPGLEVGDIIDFEFRFTNPTSIGYPMDASIHEQDPSLNSTLTLRFNHGFSTIIKGYNDLAIPEPTYEKGDSVYTWNFPYLKAVPYQANSVRENEVPFVRYMLKDIHRSFWRGVSVSPYERHETWTDLFEQVIQGFQRSNPKSKKEKYFDEFMESQLKNCDSLPRLEKFRKIQAFIRDSIQIADMEKFGNWSSGYYLYNRKIDRWGLFLLYEDVLKYFHFKRFVVFARNRYMGPIDTNFISRDSYSSIFFAFREDSSSSVHYIYPKSKYTNFEIDEIDPNLMGTEAFLVKFVNPSIHMLIRLPVLIWQDNYRNKEGVIHVDPEQNIVKSAIHTTYSGTVSTYNRIHNNTVEKDSLRHDLETELKQIFENFRLDSVTFFRNDPLPPFRQIMDYKATQENILSTPEEGITSVPLSSWLGHSAFPTYELTRLLDYYLPYPFCEHFIYRFVFPYPIDLINEKSLRENYENIFGSYSLSVNKTDDRTITVESQYIVKQQLVPAANYNLLKEINSHFNNLKDSKLIIRKH